MTNYKKRIKTLEKYLKEQEEDFSEYNDYDAGFVDGLETALQIMNGDWA